MKQISILGCGWLGFPLAKEVLKNGFSVFGSTTSEVKLSDLKKAGITPFQIQLHENSIEGDIPSFLKNSELLLINIPPKLKGNISENFVLKIQKLLPFIEKSSIKKVLFVSSTSVYADDNTTVTETTKPNPNSENGKQLVATEELLQNNKNFQTSIIRFGGLIGDNRHPIHFLSGKKNIENPNAPINLIHLDDCIGIIMKIVCHTVTRLRDYEVWNETFNAVAPFHPTRKNYYTQKAIEMNLPLPEFDESKVSVGKTILSVKVQKILDYEFQITI